MLRALGEFEITGLSTLIPFHRRLLATEQWARGETCRDLLEDDAWLASIGSEQATGEEAPAPQAVTLDYTVEVSGRRFDVRVSAPAGVGASRRPPDTKLDRTVGTLSDNSPYLELARERVVIFDGATGPLRGGGPGGHSAKAPVAAAAMTR